MLYEYECIKCFSGCERLVKYEDKEFQLCTLCGNRLIPVVTGCAIYCETVAGSGMKMKGKE